MKTFFGLRAYNTAPQVWGEPAGGCEHVWGDAPSARHHVQRNGQGASSLGLAARATENLRDVAVRPTGAFCGRCGAWRGELGSEPTVALFVAHLCEVFDAVRRVLHPSGVLLVELGDSYSGSGKGPSNSLQGPGGQIGPSAVKKPSKQTTNKGSLTGRPNNGKRNTGQFAGGQAPTVWTPIEMPAKNLLLVPFKFAIAMQDRGWILRSVMPWVRRNAMPESAVDRPSSAVSYVFLFAQQAKYFWDSTAVRVAGDTERKSWAPGKKCMVVQDHTGREDRNDGLAALGQRMNAGAATGRNMRNADLFFQSWQGLLEDEASGDPLALIVNPQPLSDARISKGHVGGGTDHFASWPEKLVDVLIRAGSSEAGVCSACRAPRVRVVEKDTALAESRRGTKAYESRGLEAGNRFACATPGVTSIVTTTGWRASCSCEAPTVPAQVLDPFGGSGTTSLVSERLGRDSVYCELNPEYVGLARRRLYGPLFAGETTQHEPTTDKQMASGLRTYAGFNARWKAQGA